MATATVLLDGRVLVAGGGHWLLGSATAELYDPASGTWTATGSMTTLRGSQFTATLLPDGRVLAVGGFDRTEATLASAELYDPASGTWTATGSMIDARIWPTITLLPDGRVLVAGGTIGPWHSDGSYVGLASAELYDPASGTWTATADMGTPRGVFNATLLLDGRVLVAGGGPNGTSAELYDPGSP
jgi:hypothetical protein